MDEPEDTFPPYDETPFAEADAEMPADSFDEQAADFVSEPAPDEEGCHA